MKNLSYFLRTDSRLNSSFSFLLFTTCMILAFSVAPERALATQTIPSAVPGVYTTAADPKATVIHGNARFAVLTPQLIRMEWAADGKFEDHASLVFLNRRLPLPKFTAKEASGNLAIKTDALELNYHPAPTSNGKFAADDLEIKFTLNGKPVGWHPGHARTRVVLFTPQRRNGLEF